MGSGPTTTANTTQQATSQPWAPTVPALTSLLGNLSSLPTSVSPSQSSALSQLLGASTGPNFAPQAANTADTLLAGGGANAQAPLVQGAYNSLQSSYAPLTNPANLNPMNTPGFSDALASMGTGITNQINDQFASAGRDLSPGNSTALAYGLAQGEAPAISGQYNSNVSNLLNAGSTLYNAGNTTANTLTGFNQAGNTNQLAGASLAGSIPGLAQAPGTASLNAANMAQNLPFANLSSLSSLLTPLAALGSQTNGSGTSTTQTQTPLWQQLLGGAIAAGSLFAAPATGGASLGGMSAAGNLAGLFQLPNSSTNPGSFGWG